MLGLAKRFSSVLTATARLSRCLSSQYFSKSYVQFAPLVQSRSFSSNVDRQFAQILTEEIKQEAECAYACGPPKGFEVHKRDGSTVVLRKSFPDGAIMEIEMDMAGSVVPEDVDAEESNDKDEETATSLEARPDLKIRLIKPSGRSVLFHCSFPSNSDDAQPNDQDASSLPTFSIDMVELEKIPGYFVYTGLFDDNMYDHILRLLTERGVDYDFQCQLQDFATSEEHDLYRKFLQEFHVYCEE
nr:Complement component 1 Q subcomponent binding [Hymenolepis microstoma]